MSAEEIESYKFQLEQVELALGSDADNEELKKLKTDLTELIQMVEAAKNIQQGSPINNRVEEEVIDTTHLKSHEFSVDQEVMARWSGDGQFYKAIITAIGGADQVFSIKFKGYSESEFVKAQDIKPIADKKRVGIFENVQDSKKKKNNVEPVVKGPSHTPKKKKTIEFENKKNAWLNFAANGSKKKKIVATPINKKSIFKTPDNPEGKVGVIGSGKGMTTFQQRGKHVYNGENNNNNDD